MPKLSGAEIGGHTIKLVAGYAGRHMTPWQKAIQFTLDQEGGWVHDPHDRGGETFRGISRRFHPDWSGWSMIDHYKSHPDWPGIAENDQAIEDKVAQFYLNNFWFPIRGDDLPGLMSVALFDMAVHSGVPTAIRLMQASLGTLTDGVIGPMTLKAAQEAGKNGVVEFLARRCRFLDAFMDANPDQYRYRLGFYRRLFRLANLVLEDINVA